MIVDCQFVQMVKDTDASIYRYPECFIRFQNLGKRSYANGSDPALLILCVMGHQNNNI